MSRANYITSTAIALGLAAALSACSTVQENPNYQYSTKYQGAGSTSYAQNGGYATTTPASYQGQSYAGASTSRSAEQDCRSKESNREIIGGAAGGALGAFAGNEIIGGTKGTLIGAAVGGTAGYGLGDISVDCSPAQPVYAAQPTYQQPAPQYQPAPVNAPIYSTEVAPQPAPVYTPQAAPISAPVSAPTDQQYAGQAVTGTPGYQVWQGGATQSAEAPIPQQPVGQAYEYSGGQNSGQPAPQNETTLTISGPVHSASTSGFPRHAQNTTNGAVEISDFDYSSNLISADTAVAAANFPSDETRIYRSQASSLQSYRVQPGDTVYGLSRKLCVGVTDIQSSNNIGQNFGINIGQTISLPQSRC